MKFFVVIFILWFICELFSPDSGCTESGYSYSEDTEEDEGLFDRVYNDGTWRVKSPGPLSDFVYSDGKTSYIDIFGQEKRSNGETVSNGMVFDKNGDLVAFEYEDVLGITNRCDW